MYDAFFSKAHELTRRGERFATATVVRAEKPTSGKPGDKAIITASGVMHGWIGGSCAQPVVIAEAQAALLDGESRLLRITPAGGTSREGVKEVAMTCFSGGTIDIYIEPHEPRPRLIIIGHLPTAQALAHLGRAMNYHTIAVDPETDGAAMQHAEEVLTDLDAFVKWANPLTFIVVATHGHFDEDALEKALGTGAPYVGLVASKKRAEALLAHLRQAGLEDELERLKVPAGLDIGARRGDEIALSIMAEIVQLRRSGVGLEWPAAVEDEDGEAEKPAAAVDPICGMTVDVRHAKHIYEHEGEMFYFCCEGCRSRFAAEQMEA